MRLNEMFYHAKRALPNLFDEQDESVMFRDTSEDKQFLYLAGRISDILGAPANEASLPLHVFNINTTEDRFNAESALRDWTMHRQKER